jgi:hypothetical protein
MRTSIGSMTTMLAVGAVGLLGAAHQAKAGCGPDIGPSPGANPWLNGGSGLHSAVLSSADTLGRFLTISDSDAPAPSIVGLWKFAFTAKGNKGIPDGAPIDAGFVTWHADGTELMNSGRAPPTQSFCSGVYDSDGPGKYELNHWALSWDSTGTVFVGPANVREKIVLINANKYGGNFTITQYATDGKTVLAQVLGTVTATRITP